MKILSVDKDKVQVELTRGDVDGIVFSLDSVLESDAADKTRLLLSGKEATDTVDDIMLLDLIADIEEKLIKTNLLDKITKGALALQVDT